MEAVSTAINEIRVLGEETKNEKSRAVKVCNASFRFSVLMSIMLFLFLYTSVKEIIHNEAMLDFIREIFHASYTNRTAIKKTD